MFGLSAKTTRQPERRKRSRAAVHACPRCRQPVRASAPRCPGCGNRLFMESAATAPPAIESQLRSDPPEPVPQYDLTKIQKRILGAAHEEGTIFVYREPGPAEGEVKSGTERFYGDDAVTAVATLIAPGLIAAAGEDCFELTHAGLRLVESLS